ncbi:hypothetical protein HYV64_00540 [Candidatus Shapirobacteria bacterium]|nr:hypothetical protein [Candidatus Shapirobacteria bacterium]
MPVSEEHLKLQQTSDLLTAERIASATIIRHAYEGGIDNDFVSDALAKQIQLGAGEHNQAMRQEADAAGLFSHGEQRESVMVHDSIHDGNEWNESWHYLASEFLNPEIAGATTEPFDRALELTQELRNSGVDVEEARYIEAVNWDDGKYDFGTEKPDTNPGIYRVWVRAGTQLQKMVEEKTQPSTQQINPR